MARLFDGINDGIVIARDAAYEGPTSAITLSVWVKRNGNQANNRRIFDKEYDNAATTPYVSYGFEWAGVDTARLVIGTATNIYLATGATAIADNTWTHLLGTLSGGTATIYNSGTSDGTVAVTGDILYDTTANGQIDIGVHSSGLYYAGAIAEIGMWSAALDAAEISALAGGACPLNIRPASIYSYLPLGLYSPEIDLLTGKTGTVTEATVTDRPRIYRRSQPMLRFGSTAAGGFQAAWARNRNQVIIAAA